MKKLLICVEALAAVTLLVSFWPLIRLKSGAVTKGDASSRWRNVLRWGTVCCRVFLVALALTPAVLLVYRLSLIPTETVSYNVYHSIPNARLESSGSCPSGTGSTLILTIRNVDVAQDIIEANVSLCVGSQALRHLEFPGGDRFPLAHAIRNHILSERVTQATFAVTYEGFLPEVSLTREVRIGSILRSSDPLSGGMAPVNVGVWTMPLLGDSSDYPLDTYTTSGLWTIEVPSGTQILFPDSVRDSYIVTPQISVNPGTADLEWHWGSPPNSGWALVASRAFPNEVFIFVLLLLPILLFLGVLLILISRKTNSGLEGGRLPGELVIGVGAFLVALLPVRAVLVPPNVPQFTFVDYVLGTEMAVIVAATLILATMGTRFTKKVGSLILAEKPPPSEAPATSTSLVAIGSADQPSGDQPSDKDDKSPHTYRSRDNASAPAADSSDVGQVRGSDRNGQPEDTG